VGLVQHLDDGVEVAGIELNVRRPPTDRDQHFG